MGHRKQTHCVQGHAFTKENTYIERRRNNHRRCRACALADNKFWDVYKRGPQHAPKKKKRR
jgi:hypothetical protein